MARLELSVKAHKDWQDSIDVSKFLNEKVVENVKDFLTKYDSSIEPQKRRLVESLVATIAGAMNLDYTLFIPTEKMNGTAGSYDRFSKKVTIFLKNSDNVYEFSPKLLTTIIHELRHAYQHQYMMYEDSELGRHVKYYTEHYTSPSQSNFVQEIGYKTNFIEVDAQRFSFAVAKALVEKIIENSANEKILTKRILNVKYNRIKSESNIFENEFLKNKEIVSNFDNILESLKMHLKSTVLSFYTTKFDSKENEQLQAKLISNSMYEFFDLKKIQTVHNLSNRDLIEVYLDVLSSIKPEDLVAKLDNPLTQFFKEEPKLLGHNLSLTLMKGDDLVVYRNYIEKLSESVEFGKIFLDKFNIDYNKEDNKDIYLKYAKYSFEYLAKLFWQEQISEFDEMLMDNITLLQTKDTNNFNRKKLQEIIGKTYSEKEIKKVLLDNIDNDNHSDLIKKFQLNKNLLNGYANCYISEKNAEIYSKFLRFKNVNFDKNNFDEIFEKFNKHFPAFVSECLSKNKLSEDEQNLIFNLAIYLNDNNSLLKDITIIISKDYSLTKLKECFEKQNNDVVQMLQAREISLDKLKELKLQSNQSQPAND